MAQDRISYLIQRLDEKAAIARVIDTARRLVTHSEDNTLSEDGKYIPVYVNLFEELHSAMDALYDAAYIELPDDAG